jgi:hypothetical protein
MANCDDYVLLKKDFRVSGDMNMTLSSKNIKPVKIKLQI